MGDLAKEIERRESKHAPLRRLLADGQWKTADELRAVAGWRYGARLLELRRGEDGGTPLEVEKRHIRDGLWEYRIAPPKLPARLVVVEGDGQVSLLGPGQILNF